MLQRYSSQHAHKYGLALTQLVVLRKEKRKEGCVESDKLLAQLPIGPGYFFS
jgi:hypothetical protein